MINKALLILITAYRYIISPVTAPCCRFHPTCSAYALQAIKEHGTIVGVTLSIKRLFKCHPFNPGGYDPVPLSTVSPDLTTKEKTLPKLFAPACHKEQRRVNR